MYILYTQKKHIFGTFTMTSPHRFAFCSPVFSLCFYFLLQKKKHKGNVFINTGHFAAAVRDESCFR